MSNKANLKCQLKTSKKVLDELLLASKYTIHLLGCSHS